LAVARAEIREEMAAVQAVAIGFGAAAVAGIVAVMLFAVALGGAIADLFDVAPWVGYGAVAVLLGAAAYFFVRHGRAQLAKIRVLPRTTATLQENMAWIQDRSTHPSSIQKPTRH
jgi:ABC-type nickel/cobalt efflux system permease component RcnA